MKDLSRVLLLEEGSFSVVIPKIWALVLYGEQAGGAAPGVSSLLPSPVIGGAAALPTDHQALARHCASLPDSGFGQLRSTV